MAVDTIGGVNTIQGMRKCAKTKKSALLKMANMLKEDANRIEEFVKSIQNESTNQG